MVRDGFLGAGTTGRFNSAAGLGFQGDGGSDARWVKGGKRDPELRDGQRKNSVAIQEGPLTIRVEAECAVGCRSGVVVVGWLVVVMMVMLLLFRLLAAAPACECRRVPFLPLCSFVALNPQLAPFCISGVGQESRGSKHRGQTDTEHIDTRTLTLTSFGTYRRSRWH